VMPAVQETAPISVVARGPSLRRAALASPI
jgi:hypothetical protein